MMLIDSDPRGALVEALQVELADEFTFYMKALGYHWNVEGPDFYEYHKLFGDIYGDVGDAIDGTAENIKKLGGFAPFTHSAYARMTTLVEDAQVTTAPSSMCADLYANNTFVIRTLSKTFAAAEAAGDQAIMDYVAGRLNMHAKWSWMLRASLNDYPSLLPTA